MTKYPFVVTVYRLPGTNRPVVQQHSFDDIGIAHAQMGTLANDKSVVKTVLSVTLKEVTFHNRYPRHPLTGR